MNHKLNLKKQLACIYTNNFFSGLRITDAVWVALLAARALPCWASSWPSPVRRRLAGRRAPPEQKTHCRVP